MSATCANCTVPVKDHAADVCMLSALCGVLKDRGVKDEKIEKILAKTDVSALWEDLGPILDSLQDGEYEREGT